MRLLFVRPVLLGWALSAALIPMGFCQSAKPAAIDTKAWQPYADSAAASLRAARDTQDVTEYDRAETAIQQLLRLSPGNYEAQKLQAAVLLGKHEFAGALKLAAELNHRIPDDVSGWSLLVDIHSAIGAYAEAERDAQWILDLRPGSALGFEKAAGLRELFGDTEGSIEFYQEANRRTSPNDTGQRAWLLTQMARLEVESGNLKQAQTLLDQALTLFPDSQLAAGVQANIRDAEGKDAEAAAIRERIYKKVNSPANLYAWAEALDKAGQHPPAAAAFKSFEASAQAEMDAPYNSNRSLIYFYTDHAHEPAKALRIAEKEEALRQDEDTLAAAAWAFYANGKYTEALSRMERVLTVGIRNPLYFCHAVQIAARANDLNAQVKYRKQLDGFSPNTCSANLPVETAKGLAP